MPLPGGLGLGGIRGPSRLWQPPFYPTALDAYDLLILGEPGLVSYWKMDEPANGVASIAWDSKGGNQGVYVKSPTYGAVGGVVLNQSLAVALDGTTQYVEIPHRSSLNLGDTFSIECWFKLLAGNNNTRRYLMSKANQFGLNFDNGAPTPTDALMFNNDGSVCSWSSTTYTSDTNWHHVVATRGGGNDKIYADGVDVTVLNTNAARSSVTNDMTVGARSNVPGVVPIQYYFPGSIQKVAVYSTALTLPQAVTHNLTGRALFPWLGVDEPTDWIAAY